MAKAKTFSPASDDSGEWFWDRVEIRAQDECWHWAGAGRSGALAAYGAVRLPTRYGRRNESAHRLAYLFAVGPIPTGKHVMHSCDNGICCNPRHLRLGTPEMNVHDCRDKGRLRNGNIKLNPAIWQAIRESVESAGILADRYGVCANHVRRIRRGASGRIYQP